ncbi:MAG TPA: twin-arginine translocase TatA/TatE family subunit [Candidatus Binatia bacterium]|nr:twin-arginine translocase TatA/TatE family subunit [Candidatus Binatia bacterium]
MDRLWYLVPAVLLIVLLIWGPGKLPEVGAGMGRAIREFRNAVSGVRDATAVSPGQPSGQSSTEPGPYPYTVLSSSEKPAAPVPDDSRRS